MRIIAAGASVIRDGGSPDRVRALLVAHRFVSLVALAALAVGISTAVLEERAVEPADASRHAASRADGSTVAATTREVMVGVYGGAPYTQASDVSVKKSGTHDFTVKEVGWRGRPLKSPPYYGARVVRWFDGGRTGAMMDFTHSKALARLDEQAEFSGVIDGAPAPGTATIGDIFRRLEATHGHNTLSLFGLQRLPALNPRLHPYIGLGAGIALPHSEVRLMMDSARTYEYQYAGPVAQVLVGIEVRVRRMSYFFEYRFSLADLEMALTHVDGSTVIADLWRQFRRWRAGEEPSGGWLTTRLTSHQAIAGFAVRFGAAPALP